LGERLPLAVIPASAFAGVSIVRIVDLPERLSQPDILRFPVIAQGICFFNGYL